MYNYTYIFFIHIYINCSEKIPNFTVICSAILAFLSNIYINMCILCVIYESNRMHPLSNSSLLNDLTGKSTTQHSVVQYRQRESKTNLQHEAFLDGQQLTAESPLSQVQRCPASHTQLVPVSSVLSVMCLFCHGASSLSRLAVSCESSVGRSHHREI